MRIGRCVHGWKCPGGVEGEGDIRGKRVADRGVCKGGGGLDGRCLIERGRCVGMAGNRGGVDGWLNTLAWDVG
jgi:hypothetical protein